MMYIRVEHINGLPVIIADEVFSDDQCNSLWKEFLFLDETKLKNPDETGAARMFDSDGNTVQKLKHVKGIVVDTVYSDRNISNILTHNRIFFSEEFTNAAEECNIFFRYLNTSTIDTTILHYYENSDFYDLHFDSATLTIVSWFYKEPKSFKGGEFIFEDGTTIKCTNNRSVIFPSILKHSVSPIEINADKIGNNYGRYSMTQFIGCV